MDPNWRTSWGLGFSVRQNDGNTVVGHGGSCPGYRSSLSITPKKKVAYVSMINASGTNPGKYIDGMVSVMTKALDADVNEEEINLSEFTGTYSASPWGSERVIIPWYGNLAVIGLPSNNPANFTVLHHVEEDTFVHKRDDGSDGERWTFERDGSGKVVKFWVHQNYSTKIK